MSHRFDDEPEELSEMNLTPFIDVILVLLIIFMIAAQATPVSQSVDLPTSKAPPLAPRTDSVTVSVLPGRGFAVNGRTVAAGQLAAALRGVGAKTQDVVLLLADRSLPYGDLMEGLDALRAAGYGHVALVGREPE